LGQDLEQNIELGDERDVIGPWYIMFLYWFIVPVPNKIFIARGEQKCEECKNIFIKIFNLKIIIYFSIIPLSYFGLKQLLNYQQSKDTS
jgi:hypothetical protein